MANEQCITCWLKKKKMPETQMRNANRPLIFRLYPPILYNVAEDENHIYI